MIFVTGNGTISVRADFQQGKYIGRTADRDNHNGNQMWFAN